MHSFVHNISISFRIFGAILGPDIELLWKHLSIMVLIVVSIGTFVNNNFTSKEVGVPEASILDKISKNYLSFFAILYVGIRI